MRATEVGLAAIDRIMVEKRVVDSVRSSWKMRAVVRKNLMCDCEEIAENFFRLFIVCAFLGTLGMVDAHGGADDGGLRCVAQLKSINNTIDLHSQILKTSFRLAKTPVHVAADPRSRLVAVALTELGAEMMEDTWGDAAAGGEEGVVPLKVGVLFGCSGFGK